MSFADRTFKELRDRLSQLTDKANSDDLNTIKMICDEFSEFIDSKTKDLCKYCEGSGEIERLVEYGGRELEQTFICEYCSGTGKA